MPPPVRSTPGRRGDPLTCPPDIRAQLGTMTDRSLSKLAGVSSATVFRWRTEAGIQPFDRRGAKDRHEAHPNAGMRELVKQALSEARPGQGGMIISHATYARLCAVFFGE